MPGGELKVAGGANAVTPGSRIKVVVVGQTPPPYHGQALMIERMLNGQYRDMDLFHVRMGFSATIHDVGTVRWKKIAELARVIVAIMRARITHGGDLLYYPPCGPDRVPLVRDVAILLSTRWLFRRTMFHFHAGGVSDLIQQLPAPVRWLTSLAYGSADLAVMLSNRNPPDGEALGARRVEVVPYGIEDMTAHFEALPRASTATGRPKVLFVGAVRESKGVMVLLQACEELAARDVPVDCDIVGHFTSASFRDACYEYVMNNNLHESVQFVEGATGNDLWQRYRDADLFCFPTFYDAETFGVVCLEAMQFGLPVVAARWRGVPDIVIDGQTGILVPVRDSASLAAAVERLVKDEQLRHIMGLNARLRYQKYFTLDRWLARMEVLMVEAAQ